MTYLSGIQYFACNNTALAKLAKFKGTRYLLLLILSLHLQAVHAANRDTTVCVVTTSLLLTNTSFNSGVWSASASNPIGCTVSNTVSGLATVTFNNPIAGNVYGFIYNTGIGATDSITINMANCPGGVPTNFWIRADTATVASGNDITEWYDVYGSGHLVTPAQSWNGETVIAPAMISSAINYNAALNFNNTAMMVSTAGLDISMANKTYYMAGRPIAGNTADGLQSIFVERAYKDYFPYLNASTGEVRTYCVGGGVGDLGLPLNWRDNEAGFVKVGISQPDVNNASNLSFSKSGAVDTLVTAGSAGTAAKMFGYLGNCPVGSEAFGQISEVIVLPGAPNVMQTQQLNSYLAIKYGVTQDNSAGGTAGNYLLSNGTPAWDAALNSNFHHDVIGISRDNVSGLLQKQSHSADDSLRIFIHALATTNKANSGVISNDKSSIIIGNDMGLLEVGNTYSVPAAVSPHIIDRIGRVWKVTNTNFADEYSIEIKWDQTAGQAFHLANLRLLVSTSATDFSNATVGNTANINFTAGSIIISGIGTNEIAFNTTRYIALGFIAPVTLPIRLTKFNAQVTGKKEVRVNWQTSNQVNSAHFAVEKSNDAIQWQIVGQVRAAGNASVTADYDLTDHQPYPGISYYRLKQVDDNGSYSYSAIVPVKFAFHTSISPNPTNGMVIIKGDQQELAGMAVLNPIGQVMYIPLISYNGQVSIDLSEKPPGIYILKTKSDTYKILKK